MVVSKAKQEQEYKAKKKALDDFWKAKK